jgi:hypothetical protein
MDQENSGFVCRAQRVGLKDGTVLDVVGFYDRSANPGDTAGGLVVFKNGKLAAHQKAGVNVFDNLDAWTLFNDDADKDHRPRQSILEDLVEPYLVENKFRAVSSSSFRIGCSQFWVSDEIRLGQVLAGCTAEPGDRGILNSAFPDLNLVAMPKQYNIVVPWKKKAAAAPTPYKSTGKITFDVPASPPKTDVVMDISNVEYEIVAAKSVDPNLEGLEELDLDEVRQEQYKDSGWGSW